MSLPSIETSGTLVALIALVVLEMDKRRNAAKRYEEQMNGGNPVVKALGRLEEATRDEHRKTRETLSDRIDRHDQRCEQRWDAEGGHQ
jgi:hypothetical protein